MLLNAFANQCHFFAWHRQSAPCYAFASRCVSKLRLAFACRNLALPLPIKTVLCIPNPSSSPHSFAIAYRRYAVALLFKSTPSHFAVVHRFALPLPMLFIANPSLIKTYQRHCLTNYASPSLFSLWLSSS